MKSLLIITAAFFCLTASAQTIIDKEDPFTHKKVKEAVVVFGKTIAPVPITLSIAEMGSEHYLIFSWNSASGIPGAFSGIDAKKCSLLFKFNTDTVIKFRPDSISPSSVNMGTQSMFTLVSKITDKELAYIMYNNITNFRVAMQEDGTGVDMDGPYMFTDRNKNQLKKACMYMLGMQEVEDKTEN